MGKPDLPGQAVYSHTAQSTAADSGHKYSLREALTYQGKPCSMAACPTWTAKVVLPTPASPATADTCQRKLKSDQLTASEI
jgi:hypothetical protein